MQSHYFSVGSVVPWARPGVGAVATQAICRADYGPRGLDLMANGAGAAEALSQLRAADQGAQSRQVAMVDSDGGAAAFTGARCLRAAGDVQRDAVSCQGNILADETVWPAMLDAYLRQTGPLAHRLLAALEAAQASGGDLRGLQSAALLVVPGTGEYWDVCVSLRVEDSPDPLGELRRVLNMHDAYAILSDNEEPAASEDRPEPAAAFRRARELAPDQPEIHFEYALSLAQAGDQDAALFELRALCAIAPQWHEVLERLQEQEGTPPAARLLAHL